MRETQIPIGALVAAIGGLLLIVSLALDWYGPLSGFNSFEFLDLLLVVLALATLATLAAALGLLHTPLRAGHAARGGTDRLRDRGQPASQPPAGRDRRGSRDRRLARPRGPPR